MDNIQYREIEASDIALIKDLWSASKKYHCEISADYKPYLVNVTFEQRIREIIDSADKAKITVAENIDNKLVGYCIATVRVEQGEIDSIYVHRDNKRLGIGSELMLRSLKWLEACKVSDIAVSVLVENKEAIGFYEKLGFSSRIISLHKRSNTSQ